MSGCFFETRCRVLTDDSNATVIRRQVVTYTKARSVTNVESTGAQPANADAMAVVPRKTEDVHSTIANNFQQYMSPWRSRKDWDTPTVKSMFLSVIICKLSWLFDTVAIWNGLSRHRECNLTRKRGNCECIAIRGRPSHASHFPFEVAE